MAFALDTVPGLPDCRVIRREPGEPIDCLYVRPEPPVCPSCGKQATTKGEAQAREVYDLPRGDTPQLLRLHAKRWAWDCTCPSPGSGPRRHPSPFEGIVAPPRREKGRERQYTARLQAYLIDQWARGAPVRDLSRSCGLRENLLSDMIDESLPDLPVASRYRIGTRRPQFIGLDEVFWRGQAITVIMDIHPAAPATHAGRPQQERHGQVIDILPSREPEALEAFFRQFRTLMTAAGHPDWRPVIASDMWGDFRHVIRRVFGGQAIHVADRFHVAAKIAAELVSVGEQHQLNLSLGEDRRFADLNARRAAAEVRPEIVRLYRAALNARRAPAPAPPPTSGTPAQPIPDVRTSQQKVPFGMISRRPPLPSPAAPPPRPAGVASSLLHPDTLRLIDLAADLDFLWDARKDQPSIIREFRTWVRDVAAWRESAQRRIRQERRLHPFRDLIYLLDRETWIIEVTNRNRPEARLVREDLPDPAGVQAPQARPSEERFASTGRVEALNRAIRALEQRSPNHRRNPFGGADWTMWNEESLFTRYRERLLYALNVPPLRTRTVTRRLEWSPTADATCGACAATSGAVVGLTRHTGPKRRAWDVPLAGARVQAEWTAVEDHCPACGAVTRPPDLTDGTVTFELEAYLHAALLGDHTRTGIQVATGVGAGRLRAMEEQIPDTPAGPMPTEIGVLEFRWRRQRRLLITERATGRPVELLSAGARDCTPEDLRQWLTQPEQRTVQAVWVEREAWLPTDAEPTGPRFLMDAYGRGRVIQRAIQALQKDFTNELQVSVRQTPVWRGHRKLLLGNAEPRTWPLLDRVHAAERLALRGRMLEHPGLAFGLEMIDLLRQAFGQGVDHESVTTWLDLLDITTQERLASAPAADRPGIERARRALLRVTEPLKRSALHDAVLRGAVASEDRRTQREADPAADLPPASLGPSRRRLKDLRESRAFRARDEFAWKRLRRVALTGIGRTP